ncbi:MIF4G domain containing protein, putative [Babesia bigemina]|uniref:MIF4G domain containing protein, putative n=1 Tax=Babesia bigemina TaxID=5866 RepID=A0A061D374_BABBI|nr:MIF4G domain containing protein, putative [Babesia bigemina]CDR95201.1 MIF4G domain containing protein, putative [Babesia bigemina]|eukprot:XP_012767387.1 MIF4G domain containing protein, putative [Babesia bigemina]
MTSTDEQEKAKTAETRTSTFNPDAPVFKPSQPRPSGQLNANAPEFIPGQLGTYDGGIGYVSVPDVKHGKGYNKGGYHRPISYMHPADGQYPPAWSPPHQQYMPLWVPCPQDMYGGAPMYDYVPYRYGGGRGYEGPDGQPRPMRGPRHGTPTVQGHKREASVSHAMGMPPPPHGPPKRVDPVDRRKENKDQGKVSEGKVKAEPKAVTKEPAVRVPEVLVAPIATPPPDAKPKQFTWADRFRQSSVKEEAQDVPKVEESNLTTSIWKGRPTFADMMKKAAEAARKEEEVKIAVAKASEAAQKLEMESESQKSPEKSALGVSPDVASEPARASAALATDERTVDVAEDTLHKTAKAIVAENEVVEVHDETPNHRQPKSEQIPGKDQRIPVNHIDVLLTAERQKGAVEVKPEQHILTKQIPRAEESIPSKDLSEPLPSTPSPAVQPDMSSHSFESNRSEGVTPSNRGVPSSPSVHSHVLDASRFDKMNGVKATTPELSKDEVQSAEYDASLDHYQTLESSPPQSSNELPELSESETSEQWHESRETMRSKQLDDAASSPLVDSGDEVEEPIADASDVSAAVATPSDKLEPEPFAKVKQYSPPPSDLVFPIDTLVRCGFELMRVGLEFNSELVFSLNINRDTNAGTENRRTGGARYEEKNYAQKYKGDNWVMQRRHAKPEQRGFGGWNKSSMEFSRDQLESLSRPQASESSWIRKQAKLKMDKDHQLTRRLMGLLNRLTVEKFDTIYRQVLMSGVETVQQAFMLVKIIFEKAITQHHFIPMYVELCAKLSCDLDNFLAVDPQQGSQSQQDTQSTAAAGERKAAKRSEFMRILLNCCQDSFENNLKPLEFPPELEGDDKFEFELKYKHRMRGNMIFVGELFKQKLLAAKLLITCLDQVFAKRNECIASTGSIDTGDNHLEGMCTLLQTVGKSFDTDKWKYASELERRIQMLTDLGRNPQICFRIRCLIQNVLDSRHEKWVKSTPYKLEGPCRLQELRSKVMEQEKQQEDHAWRTKRRGKSYEVRAPSPRQQSPKSSAAPNVLSATSIPPPMTADELKRRTRGIVREFVMSHDPKEASLCVSELNLQPTRDWELYAYLFSAALEACAKLTADQDRRIVAKWMTDLAIGRSSQDALVKWLHGFLKDEPADHGYSMMIEDYPVVPLMLKELLNCMKESYSNVRGFAEVEKIIEGEIYPAVGLMV